MRVSEAISRARQLKPNLYDDDVMSGWLTELDGRIARELIERSCPPPPIPDVKPTETPEDGEHPEASENLSELPVWPPDYSRPSTWENELLAKRPYDNMYPLYLVAMIDFHNRETDSYANDMVMFNAALANFRSWYRRRHVPKESGRWRNL